MIKNQREIVNFIAFCVKLDRPDLRIWVDWKLNGPGMGMLDYSKVAC